jgi:hypothetical protein
VLRSVDLTEYDSAPFAPNIIVIAELPEAGSNDVDIGLRVLSPGSFFEYTVAPTATPGIWKWRFESKLMSESVHYRRF